MLVSAIVNAELRHLWWRLNTVSAGMQLADVLVVVHPVSQVSKTPGFAIFSPGLPPEARTETQALSERGSSMHHYAQQVTLSRLHVRGTLARNGIICAPRRWTRSRFETARAERALAYCQLKTPLWIALLASSAVPPSPCVEERKAVLYELFVCSLATAGMIVVRTEQHRALSVTTANSCMECHVKILCNVGVISEASFAVRGSGAY